MNDLETILWYGKYEEAEAAFEQMEEDQIRNALLSLAFDTESLCAYSFVQYMMRKTEKVFWLRMAAELMMQPLCFIEGAYSIALFHARELLSREKNVENLERILFFYDIPEKLVDREEALQIAKEILKAEPSNPIARAVK